MIRVLPWDAWSHRLGSSHSPRPPDTDRPTLTYAGTCKHMHDCPGYVSVIQDKGCRAGQWKASALTNRHATADMRCMLTWQQIIGQQMRQQRSLFRLQEPC